MVFFGRKEKIEDRRLLASIDAVNGAKLYQIENGNDTMVLVNYWNSRNFVTSVFFMKLRCFLVSRVYFPLRKRIPCPIVPKYYSSAF